MAFQGNTYIVTYDEGDNTSTQSIEVVAEDDALARTRVLMLFPNAQNIVVSSAS